MSNPVISIVRAGATQQRKRQAPKGRSALPQALADVAALIGEAPYLHDLLLKYPHRFLEGMSIAACAVGMSAIYIADA